jgi:D-galactarolactone isomerase
MVPARLKPPPGTTDTHMHIYGPAERYPKRSPEATIPARRADVAAYREVMRRVGIERVVVVQAAAYGFDNSCTLDAMVELGRDVARGVATVGPETSEAKLERLTEAGVRGARFFMLKGGVVGWDALEATAARVASFGWHVQLQFDGRELPDREEEIRRLPCNFVIDHNGKYLEPVAPDHPAMKSLLRLLDSGRCWVKCSAPYETSKQGPPAYEDVGAIAKAIIRSAPERVVWASNWPHPSLAEPADEAALLDLLLDWAPDEATRRRILVDNPAALYGF